MNAVEFFARWLHPAGTARKVETPLLDRVFPPDQCVPERGDEFVERFVAAEERRRRWTGEEAS